MAKRRSTVITNIKQAFADTVYPSGVKLTDCKWNCPACAEISEVFSGKHWTSLTDVEFLRHYEAALSLLQPEAFRYYLPAFMLAALNDPRRADIILDGLEFHLTPPATEGAEAEEWFAKFGQTKMDYFLHRVSGFTLAQKKAIEVYLQYSFANNWSIISPDRAQENQHALEFWDTFEG